MVYQIEFLKTAKKELSQLPLEIQKRLRDKIDSLKTNPYPFDVKKLKNSDGLLRIRVGDYRIIYRVEKEVLVILVVKLGHRRSIYKN